MEHNNHQGDGLCCKQVLYPSAVQTLDEMDFEKGIWTAALDGDISRLQKFISKPGFDVNIRDRSGYTALHYAARKGVLEVCRLLISSGADVNVQTRSCSSTPLHRAAQQGHASVVSLLLAQRADPQLQDCDGMTALHKAAQYNRSGVCRILARCDPAALNVKDNKGRAPSDCAATVEIKQLL